MYNKCLFYYVDEDGDFSTGFVLDVPLGIDYYADLIQHHFQFFKSDRFKEYILKTFNATDCTIAVRKNEIEIYYNNKYGEYHICFTPRFVTSFETEI